MASALQSLPNELKEQIIICLEASPPSERNANNRPEQSSIVSQFCPIKNLSHTSHHFHALLLPRLFRHARVNPHELTDFLAFIEVNSLARHIVTITAIIDEPCIPEEPCINTHPAWWARLLNDIPITTFNVIAPPQVFSSLTGLRVDDSHAWAFNMPYHFLTLTQPTYATNLQISYTNLPNLLTARPWLSMSYNEGSSIKAYATYEFFLKSTPCLLSSLSTHVAASTLLDTIKSFSFVAIFPFYNHVDEVLKCVRKMKKLRRFFIKLCPDPTSSVLADEIEAINNHIDVNDPWNELDTAYSLVAHTVRFLSLEGELERFEVDDVGVAGIRDSIEEKISGHLHDAWLYERKGLWCRRT